MQSWVSIRQVATPRKSALNSGFLYFSLPHACPVPVKVGLVQADFGGHPRFPGARKWVAPSAHNTVRMNVLMVTFATAFVAVVGLLVAALGITNAMIMSVLERTHEIGIMKALGARTDHIRLIFLIEGAVLGLAGGLIGLALAYLASYPGAAIAKSIMEPQTQTPVKGSLFVYPLWLVLGAPALAALITTLAAVYPAHRAASVDPITSLRHE